MKTISFVLLSLLVASIECGYFITSYYSSCGGSLWWDIYETTTCHYLGASYNYYDCSSSSQIMKYDCKDENCEDCVQVASWPASKCIYGIEFTCTSQTTVKVPTGYIGELSYNNTVGCNNSPYYAALYPKNYCINESPYLSMEFKCSGAYVDMYTCFQPNCPTSNSQVCDTTQLEIGCFHGNGTNWYEQVVCN